MYHSLSGSIRSDLLFRERAPDFIVCEIIGPVRMEFVSIFSLARNLGSISLWNFYMHV